MFALTPIYDCYCASRENLPRHAQRIDDQREHDDRPQREGKPAQWIFPVICVRRLDDHGGAGIVGGILDGYFAALLWLEWHRVNGIDSDHTLS